MSTFLSCSVFFANMLQFVVHVPYSFPSFLRRRASANSSLLSLVSWSLRKTLLPFRFFLLRITSVFLSTDSNWTMTGVVPSLCFGRSFVDGRDFYLLHRHVQFIIIIIKCMWSRCRRDDIHVCFAYASPQRMPHM